MCNHSKQSLRALFLTSTLISVITAALFASPPIAQAQAKAIDVTLLEKANAGDATSQFLVGVAYDSGEVSQRDYVRAAEWYRRAAEQGNVNAHFDLGSL